MLSRVKARCLLSWEELDYNVRTGVSNIDGWNEDDDRAEGSGKSAIPNIMSWIAFGKIPKDANIDEILMDGKESGGGILEFDNGDAIVRERGPNQLYLMKAGAMIKGKDMKETQLLIEEYLGQNFDSFCQSVYFAQNYDKKFLPSGQADKGKILSGIQNLKVFDKAAEEAQKLIKAEKDNSIKLKNQLTLDESNLNNAKTQKALVESFIQEKIKNHQNQKGQLIQQRNLVAGHSKNIETQLQSILEKLNGLDVSTAQIDITELSSAKTQYQEQLAQVRFQKSQIDIIKKNILQKEVDGKHLAKRYQDLDSKKNLFSNAQQSPSYKMYVSQRESAVNYQNSPMYQKCVNSLAKLEAFMQNPTATCPTCGSELKNIDLSHTQKEIDMNKADMETMRKNSEFSVITIDSAIAALTTQFQKDLESTDKEMADILVQLQEVSNYLDSNKVPVADELVQSELQINQVITQIDQAIQQTNNKVNEYNQLVNQHSSLSTQKSGYDQQCNQLEAQIAQLGEPDISQDQQKIKGFEETIVKYQESMESVFGLIEASAVHLKRLEDLKEGFKEIKSHVFNNAINALNFRANKYLNDLFKTQASVKFINENQEIKTVITLGGKSRSYSLLSGGQQRRFNLAVDLALADIVLFKGTSKFGLMIFDEYFKDLSEASMNICTELLSQKKCPVVLIEHNSLFKNMIHSTFFVRYKNGVSRGT